MPTLGLSQIEWRETIIPLVRHDFCGPFGVELYVPAERAVEFHQECCASGKAVPVGDDAVQVHRIEAGLPWPGHEITDEYLPAETRQLERAVSFQKGCYLGQEVVERMRSRHVVARQLVGLRLDGPAIPALKSEISDTEGKPIGHVTSSCHSQLLNCPIALAYVKTASSSTGSRLTVAGVPATIVDLPFRI
jgi:folate-binding protein YgfZ